VAALADMLTRRMGMSDEERGHVHFAALLHDIG
jgi:HD-GYP domain-containing protein (c-di-GMP phosphodiesterase class II)